MMKNEDLQTKRCGVTSSILACQSLSLKLREFEDLSLIFTIILPDHSPSFSPLFIVFPIFFSSFSHLQICLPCPDATGRLSLFRPALRFSELRLQSLNASAMPLERQPLALRVMCCSCAIFMRFSCFNFLIFLVHFHVSTFFVD